MNTELQHPLATSVWQTLLDTLTSPREAFDSISVSPRGLFPLLIVISTSLLVTAYYFSVLDLSWWIDDTLKQAKLSGDELEVARETMGSMGRGAVFAMGGVATVFFTALMILVQSIYISLTAAVMGSDYRFKHWFALAAWSATPYLISSVAIAVNVSLHPNGQLGSYSLDPTNLVVLGLSIEGYESLLRSINLPMLWSLGLIVIGFGQWQKISLGRSALIMLAPYAVLVGIVISFS